MFLTKKLVSEVNMSHCSSPTIDHTRHGWHANRTQEWSCAFTISGGVSNASLKVQHGDNFVSVIGSVSEEEEESKTVTPGGRSPVVSGASSLSERLVTELLRQPAKRG